MYAKLRTKIIFFLVCSCKENILVYACDCSTEALERATENIHVSNVVSPKTRFLTFCWDFSTSRYPKWLLCDSCSETPFQKQNNERSITDITSLKESECCIGSVDFVTLVCPIISNILTFPCLLLFITLFYSISIFRNLADFYSFCCTT